MNLTTPLEKEIYELRAGDLVTLSGTVYTARDEAHIRMKKEGIPFPAEGAVVYHCGPVIKGDQILAAGPTTSARMNPHTDLLIHKGVRGIIGKGGMDASVVESLRGNAIYFSFTGGCAALAASCMRLAGVIWEDLGMAEAVWIIELDHLPLVVGIDAYGKDLFSCVQNIAVERFRLLQERSGLYC